MRRLLLAALATAWCSIALAQSNFTAPGNQNVPGSVEMCLNGSGQAVACSTTNPLPVAQTATAPGTAGAGFPSGAVPITGNSTGAGAAVVGTLAAVPTRTTYICGFNASAIGGAATIGPITVAGLVGSSQVYQVPVNSAAGAIVVSQTFTPCIPASALNTAITVTTTADATSTATDINVWGFQQ